MTLLGRNDLAKPVSTAVPSHSASFGPHTSGLAQDSDAPQQWSAGKNKQTERPLGDAHGHTAVTLKPPGHGEPSTARSYPEGVGFNQEEKNLRGLSPQEAATATQLDLNTVGYMPAYHECNDIADFLSQYFLTEPRSGLFLTPAATEHHLRLHNNTCGHLVEMLAALLRADLPAAERHTLGLLHKISQHNMLQTWPGERLQLRATTMRVGGLLGELAEFEARRLDFMITTKATLLEVCETLYNPRGAATATHVPQLAHFLDLKPTVTWILVVLPEDLTHPRLQLATLHQTLGLLGGINEIFLFKPRPEGFIIFNGNLHLPNIDGIITPQGTWIGINNPQYPSPPIRTATSPHYPTRRPEIGSLVTLVDEQLEATVVAIEQKYWPEEWVYLIRLDNKLRLPTILYSILHRNGLKPRDIPYRIRPTALHPADSEEAFFFNNFERQTKATVIGQNSPGFFDTIRLVQPPGQLSPRAIIQTIPGHRLFQWNESLSKDRHSAQTRYGSTEKLDSTPQAEMRRDQTTLEAGPRAGATKTVPSHVSQDPSTPPNSTPSL